MRRRLALGAALVLALSAALAAGVAVARAGGAATPARWTSEVVDLAGTLPVQEDGRVKPLETHAAYTLLFLNHKRSCKDASDEPIGPTAWFLDVLFRPEVAVRHECFLVENSEVLDAIGIDHEKLVGRNGKTKGRRDRYSYEQLRPAFEALTARAKQYRGMEKRDRSAVEDGVVDLWHAVVTFDRAMHALDFARPTLSVPDLPPLRALWGGRGQVSALDVLEKAADLNALLPEGHAKDPASPEERAAQRMLEGAESTFRASSALHLIPPEGPADEQPTWFAPWDVVRSSPDGGGVGETQVAILRGLGDLVRARDDATAFAGAMSSLHDEVVRAAEARDEYSKVPLEVTLRRLDPFYWATVLYVLGFVVLAFSWIQGTRWISRAALVPILGALALQIVGIVIRCVLREHPPIGNLYDTFVFVSTVGVAALLVVERIQRNGIALALAPVIGAALLLTANRFEVLHAEDTMTPLVAVLDTNFWLATHVTCINLGYMGSLLAALVGHVYVLGKVFGLRKGDAGFYRVLARMNYGMLCFGLLFAVVGTILGGIWANQSWGRFWGWDPKENGALMICLSQIAILHARLGGMLKAFGIAIASILSGCVLMFSWLGVNLLGIGLHAYGFAGGIQTGLFAFYGVEVLVLVAAVWARIAGRALA